MDVNVHAIHTKTTAPPSGMLCRSRLVRFVDFVGIARRFIVGRVMDGEAGGNKENGLFDAWGHGVSPVKCLDDSPYFQDWFWGFICFLASRINFSHLSRPKTTNFSTPFVVFTDSWFGTIPKAEVGVTSNISRRKTCHSSV